jgi:peptidoglycan/xylan/chitin deacetylase (PgdA/CDA1 family)
MPVVLASATAAEPANWVEPLFRRHASGNGQSRVALTLDACPGGWDQRITQVLIAERVMATIFMTELWMKRNPDGLALLLDHRDLFAIENHGARHIPPLLGTGTMYGLKIAGTLENVRRDVEDGAAAIKAATGVSPTWYRGATARYSPAAIDEIHRLGFRVAAYSLSADQGASLPAGTVAHRMATSEDGDVIIGHVNQPHRPSGEGIVQGIIALRRMGFSFVHLNDVDPVSA